MFTTADEFFYLFQHIQSNIKAGNCVQTGIQAELTAAGG